MRDVVPFLGEGAGKRRETIENDLPAAVRAIRAKYPRVRSVMFAVAQYWDDCADDAVHDHLVASERATPLWPHACDGEDYAEDVELSLAGEYCDRCDPDFPYMRFDDNSYAIWAFAAFCREACVGDDRAGRSYRPYAIARIADDDGAIEVEIVGAGLRPEVIGSVAESPPLLDARAEALLDEIAARPADDGPRHVLADHLIQCGDPRGELIALGLAPPSERSRAILDEQAHAALGRAADVIVHDGARFARGLLREAIVYAGSAAHVEAVRGAPVWRTLEVLRYRPASLGILEPAMRALREVYGIHGADIATIATAPHAWAIETLGCRFGDGDGDAAQLARATTLPALRHLVVGGTDLARSIAALARAPFWSQLDQVTLVKSADGLVPIRALPELANVPRLGWGPNNEDDQQPAGWRETLVRATNTLEIELVGYDVSATISELDTLVHRARKAGQTVKLVASRYWAPADNVIESLTRTSP